MKDLVSIIIPCYNAENYIEKALNSLDRQTYKNIEVICINDGSSDNTLVKLETYQRKHTINMRIITTINGGVSSARNIGIDAARGKYIMFLDSDDTYSDRVVEVLVKAIINNNVDTAFAYWTSDHNKLKMGKFELKEHKMKVLDITSHFMYRPTPVSFFNFVYKKSILEEFNIRFDNDLKYGEDNLFFWKYLCHINSGVYLNCPLYWYYQNPCSAMHNPTWKIVDAVISGQRAMKCMKKYNYGLLEKYKRYSPARTRFAIAKQFASYGKKELFKRFYAQYGVKENMKALIGKNGMKLSIASIVLMRYPNVFYHVVRCSHGLRENLK